MPFGINVKGIMPYGKPFAFLTVSSWSEEKKKADFAKIIGSSQPNLSRYESGRQPPADVMQKITDYGRVSVKWLLTGKEEKKDLEQPRPLENLSHVPSPEPPVKIQEFLLAQVLGANEEFWGIVSLSWSIGPASLPPFIATAPGHSNPLARSWLGQTFWLTILFAFDRLGLPRM